MCTCFYLRAFTFRFHTYVELRIVETWNMDNVAKRHKMTDNLFYVIIYDVIYLFCAYARLTLISKFARMCMGTKQNKIK